MRVRSRNGQPPRHAREVTIKEHNLLAWVVAFERRHHRWPTVRECARGLRTRQDVVRLMARSNPALRIDVAYPHGDPMACTEVVRDACSGEQPLE